MKTTKMKQTAKNVQIASARGGQTNRNTGLIKVLAFFQQTMETLSEFIERLKTQFDIDQTFPERSSRVDLELM